MYQRQLHKTSIYFLKSENTTLKKKSQPISVKPRKNTI